MNIKVDLLKNHADSIPALARILYKYLIKWFPDIEVVEVEDWLHTWLNDDIPLAYIALDGSVPVGVCSLQLNDGIRPELMPWLGDLCVYEAYQNRGIGKTLVKSIKNKAKELGYSKLYLFALKDTMSGYYERLGWRAIGDDNFNGHKVNVMEIDL